MDKENSRPNEQREQRGSMITSGINGKLGRYLNKFFVSIGIIFIVCAMPYAALQLVRCQLVQQSLACTYIALAIISFALAFILRGAFPYWVIKRRTVEQAELNGLYSEIDRYRSSDSKDQLRIEAVKQAESEKTKLQSLGRPVFELDALPLRQALVDLYHPTAELIAKVRGELEYIEEYANVEGADRINGIINDIEKITAIGANDEKEKEKRVKLERRLRAELKSLRDTAAWYDRTWAIGEWTSVCVTCWACATVLVTVLVGILPIIHSQGNWNLCIVHWAVLGTTGALLSILIKLDKLDVPTVGETAGKELLQGTIRSIGIGALTAVLIYSAICGGALEGVIFPDLPTNYQAQSQVSEAETSVDVGESTASEIEAGIGEGSLRNIGLSIFWAVFAGLSPAVLQRMSRIAESSLGELRSENGGE